MINKYLDTTAILKRWASTDEYNEHTYTTITIPCRIDGATRLVRTVEGQEIVSTAVVFTKDLVTTKDLINDRIVVDVKVMSFLGSGPNHYEVYLL